MPSLTTMPKTGSLTSRLCQLAAAAVLTLSGGLAHSADGLQRFVDQVQSFQADFAQVQTDDQGQTLGESAGHFVLDRPGKFRWEYTEPYVQLMVCDGEKLWAYDPDLAQATVRPAESALAGTPAELLSRGSALDDSFTVTDGALENGVQQVHLAPKSTDSEFAGIELWLRDGAPERMRFEDRLGTQTEVRFTEIKVNQPVPAALLEFDPPEGTEVVDSATPDA